MTERGLYLFLRIIQYIALFIIIGLEITQIVLFKTYNDTESSENPEEFYKQHGFKYFYYIVIISTLIYSLYNLITFTRRWRTGPHQKIIYVEILFLLLWLAVGFTNIYPMYFGDSKPNCNVEEEIKDIPGRITECRTYFASMIIGWLMALLFLLTTIYLMYLWTRRDKKVDPNEKDRNEPEPEPEPHPDSPVV